MDIFKERSLIIMKQLHLMVEFNFNLTWRGEIMADEHAYLMIIILRSTGHGNLSTVVNCKRLHS